MDTIEKTLPTFHAVSKALTLNIFKTAKLANDFQKKPENKNFKIWKVRRGCYLVDTPKNIASRKKLQKQPKAQRRLSVMFEALGRILISGVALFKDIRNNKIKKLNEQFETMKSQYLAQNEDGFSINILKKVNPTVLKKIFSEISRLTYKSDDNKIQPFITNKGVLVISVSNIKSHDSYTENICKYDLVVYVSCLKNNGVSYTYFDNTSSCNKFITGNGTKTIYKSFYEKCNRESKKIDKNIKNIYPYVIHACENHQQFIHPDHKLNVQTIEYLKLVGKHLFYNTRYKKLNKVQITALIGRGEGLYARLNSEILGAERQDHDNKYLEPVISSLKKWKASKQMKKKSNK